MLTKLKTLIAAGVIAIALESSTAHGQTGLGDLIKVPPVPTDIIVPAGNTPFLKGQAVGTQNYICSPAANASGAAWKLFGPQATLFFTFKWFNSEIRQQITTHFLSPNPDEAGIARPTWQSSLDSSAVWGKVKASYDKQDFVAPGAIPWLLVEIVGDESGPAGGASLTPTKFIHRLNTAGGVAPATGCSGLADLAKTAIVPYTTDYYFYKASK
jgi:hypothetical protein